MTKKSRKARAKSRASGGYQRKATEKPHETTISKPAIKSTVTSKDTSSLAVSQKNQYQYIVPELKRIAVISVGLIIILIILTFVLG
jgi:hypothetical protein